MNIIISMLTKQGQQDHIDSAFLTSLTIIIGFSIKFQVAKPKKNGRIGQQTTEIWPK